MQNKEVKFEAVKDEYKSYGGRGLIAKIMSNEVIPNVNPIGKENKLIFCSGLLTGTTAPCSGRLSIGGKSPLTGTIKEANAGGTFSLILAKHGIKAIVIEEKPKDDNWYILKIEKDNASLINADEFVGMNNYQLVDNLREKYGEKISIASIGCSGERLYKNSTIQVTDMLGRPSRAAARGGLGSVMGSKRIKAVIIDSTVKGKTEYYNKDNFLSSSKKYVQGIKENPVSGQALPALGTAVLVNMVNAMGGLPTNNFSNGRFDKAEEISGEKLLEIQSTRHGKTGHVCHPGCVIGCSNIYNDKNNKYLTSGFEYETIALVGSNCGISSLDVIAEIDRKCDDLGIDTIETGCTLAVYMEAGKIKFGDEIGVLNLINEIEKGSKLGNILGQGTEYVGKHLGVKRIPVVKGQSLAAYDPRALKGTGVTYATSPMGADYTAGNALGNPTVDPYKKEGQVELSTTLQIGMALFDSLGMCIFSGFCIDDQKNIGYLIEMMAAKFGGEWNPDRLFGIGVETLALEKRFNQSAGFTDKDNKLPDFMYTEILDSTKSVFDISSEELKQVIPF